MRKFFFFCLLAFAGIKQLNAQTLGILKSSNGGAGNLVVGRAVATDDAGNIYETGAFNSNTIFGSFTLTSAGSTDIYIVKYNSSGTVLWAKRAGGSNADIGFGIAVNGTSVYITGQIGSGASNFNTPSVAGSNEITTFGFQDIFIAKYDDAGNFQWAKRGGSSTGPDIGNGIAVNGTSVYITGTFGGTSNFNTPSATGSNEITSIGGQDIFIAKYDDAGNFQWARRGGSSNSDVGYGIAANGTSVYITGVFTSTANFNTPSTTGSNELTSADVGDIFIAKYDDNGNVQWLKRAGGTSSDIGFGIAVNGTSVYITGEIGAGTSNFNTPSASGSNQIFCFGVQDIFIAKYDDAGSFQWAKRAGGSDGDHSYSITANSTSVYVTGVFTGTANFNTPIAVGSNEITSASSSNDIFLAKYNAAGNFQWAKRGGGSNNDVGYGIALNGTSAYITGYINRTANFNTPSAGGSNELTSSSQDAFLAEYIVCTPNTGTFTVSACNSYTWAAKGNKVYTTNNNTDTIHLTNIGGCDSLVTLNLTIKQSTISATNISVCPSALPYSWNGLTFNTAGVQTAHLTNAAGCDSAATLILIIKQVTSSSTTAVNCGSYTWNGTTYTISGTYNKLFTGAGGCDSIATLNLTIVTSLPSINGADAICVGSTTTLSNAIPGGTWFTQATSQATIDATTGLVTGKNAGTIIIQYSKTACGSTTKTFTVNAIPSVPSITYAPGTPNPQIGAPTGGFCVGKTFSVVGTPNVPAGSWSANGFASITSVGMVSINAVGAGSIKYTYTDANGCSNSRVMSGTGYTCAARGTNTVDGQLSTVNGFTMYPNPAKGFININVETLVGNGQIVVTDLYGKSVKTQNLSMGTNTVYIANLSKGFYLISVITSEGKTTKKLIVE